MTGSSELLIIGLVVLLLFGSAWLPKAARNLGRSKVELDKAKAEFEKAKTDITDASGLTEARDAVKKVDETLKKNPKDVVNKALDL